MRMDEESGIGCGCAVENPEDSKVPSEKVALVFGALLHDIGKIVFRGSSAQGTHSKLGADFIAEDIAARNPDFEGEAGKKIIEQIRYHHAEEIAKATSLADSSLAFITYFADNISAGMDRKNEGDEIQGARFDRNVKLHKIFNILNGRNDNNVIEHDDYNSIRERIKRNLQGIRVSWREVNSLIQVLEATTSAVPSSTDTSQLVDVSLFDHAKTTAGIATCMYEYLKEQEISNYRQELFDKRASQRYYAQNMFLLYSCDMSGIQDFIYNISGDGALKQLRARSLYLELLLEHIVDELLDRLLLSRANLLYTGGGHAYMLLPNTRSAKRTIDEFEKELRAWFIGRYRTDLFLASAWVECSADDLANRGNDGKRYRELYRSLSQRLSDAKAARYSAETISKLNFEKLGEGDHSRECRECHRSDVRINESGTCELCSALMDVSKQFVTRSVFVISEQESPLELPCGRFLSMYSRDTYLNEKPSVVRVYTKNDWDAGLDLSTHIWMGDYTKSETGEISEYASRGSTLKTLESATPEGLRSATSERPHSESILETADNDRKQLGVERLGVLRADVDNLGSIFVNGIPDDKVSISRSSTLSRSLSYFFKKKINDVLREGDYQAQIIYSGGDDLFIIGNWSDILYAAIDIRKALDEYTGNGVITLSAGVGMFDSKYPIARMAEEVGELEDAAKLYQNDTAQPPMKNAIALWSRDTVFSWGEFSAYVVPRYKDVEGFFDCNEKGKAFIYRFLSLLRNFDEVISKPRLAYLLARSFEDDKNVAGICKKFYDWAEDPRERAYLIFALEWYVYSIRERG